MRKVSLLFVLTAICIIGYGQGFSNKGKEFWLAYCFHVGMIQGGNPTMTLYMTSDVATTYTISIYNGATLTTGSITPGVISSYTVPTTYFINNDGLFTNKAIVVTAASPIVLYSFETRSAASAATLCLPKNVLGTDYISMNYTQKSNEDNSNSYITIVAVEDNTNVEIIPSATTKAGWIAGSVHNIALNKGEIYQVLGTSVAAGGNNFTGTDLSGTTIRSIAPATGGCKKIAVFSGSGKMYIQSAGCSASSSDNLYQQLYPLATWGKKYLTVPSANRPNNFYRIWKSTASPVVMLNGTVIPVASFTNGYYEFYNGTPNVITSNDPIAVTQYFTTQGCAGNPSPYDPEMIVLNPVEQNINSVTLINSALVASAPPAHQHYISAVIKNQGTAISSFRLDGAVPAGTWTTHPGDPTYSYLNMSVAQSQHKISSDSGFNALAYGYAGAESYGYSAGTNVIDLYNNPGLQTPGSIVPNLTAGCINTPFKFKISYPYQPISLTWDFHGDPNHPNVTQSAPLAYDSVVVINGQNVYWYSLPGNYTYTAPGSYQISVTAQTGGVGGCGSESVKDFEIAIENRPTAGYSFNTPACLNEVVNFTNSSTTAHPFYQWNWNFSDPGSGANNTSGISAPTHLFTSPGTYTVSYWAMSEIGCKTDTLQQQVIVPANPTATISGAANVCINTASPVVTFTGSGGVLPYTFTYTINGGAPQTIVTTGTNTSATISVPTGSPTNQLFALVSVSTGTSASCVTNAAPTDTVRVIVRDLTTANISGNTTVCQDVATAPQVTFTANGGIAPYTFTYNINGGTSQTITTTSGNSITITVPLTTPGTFAYNLTNVADAGGNCVQTPSGTATVTVKATPSISFAASPAPPAASLCNNRTITFTPSTSIAAGSVITWDWDFGDGNTQQLTNGNPFTHVYTTAGPKTVVVTATSDLGCTKTFTLSININQRPSAGFISPNVCLADLTGANFIDTSNANGGTLTNWNWNFGDPSSPNNTSTLQNPNHYYNTTGVKNVTLIVTNQGGCTDTLLQQITINGSIPLANFAVQNQANLCSNNTVSITNTSTVDVGSVIKNEIYWDYANNPTAFDTHPFPTNGQVFTHNYPVSNTDKVYRIRYRAFSGITCINDKFLDITVHAKPDPIFAAVAPICLNNGTIQLTQGSEANGIAGAGVYTGTGVTLAGVFDPLAAGVGTHTLTWVYTTNFGCKDSTNRDVTVLQAPVSNFDVSALKCERTSITFTPTATSTVGTLTQWIWNFGDSPNNQTTTTNAPVTHTYQNTGNYVVTLTVVTSDGCRSTPFTQTIFVNPTPVPQFSFTASACLPQAKIDFTNNTPNVANYTYVWDFGDPSSSNNSSNTSNSSHTYTAVGPYSVVLTATSPTTGCTHDTTMAVNTIHRPPLASFKLSATDACIDKPLSVTDLSNPVEGNITNWVWAYGDNSTATGQSPAAHLYTAQGTYPVKLTVTTGFGCADDTTISFRVWNYPVANAGPNMFVLEGGSQTIFATASGQSLSYNWTTIPAGYTSTLNSTTVLQPIVTPTQDMRYMLTVSNPANCIDTSSVFVKVLRQPDIPNTFSPNNDGINDYWVIDYLNTYPQCKVQVFTRTGQKVFESRGYKQPWDGNMNGKSLPMDTYYYIIEPGNGRTPLKGYIQIIK